MKKILLMLLLLTSIGTLSCGSGGAGPANVPPGENPGIASVIRLQAAQYIAQINASIYLRAKVLDGNGLPVPNKTVTFTNLSTIGTLSSSTVNTDASGIASVKLDSTISGFLTIQASMDSGAGQIFSKNTVYFSPEFLIWPTPVVLPPTLRIDIDSNNNGIYNETADYTMLNNSANTQALVRVTVLDGYNSPVANTTVTFNSDSTYATFPQGNTKATDKNGQAVVLLKVTPPVITSYTTTLNITASAANGAASMTTIFLSPVVIATNTSHITATPSTVALNGTSTINAYVLLNTGAPAPDATTVNFTADCGTVTPFAQTTAGVAPATFTAPSTPGTCKVSASVGAATIGSVNITATTALTVSPLAMTIAAGDTAAFTISGGVAGYKITSSNPSFPASTSSVSTSGGTFSVTAPAVGTATTVTYTIIDSAGAVATATLTINPNVSSFYLLPASATITVGGSVTMFINGGTSPYSIITDSNAVDLTWDGSSSFTVTGVSTGTVNITVQDSKGKVAVGIVTVQ